MAYSDQVPHYMDVGAYVSRMVQKCVIFVGN